MTLKDLEVFFLAIADIDIGAVARALAEFYATGNCAEIIKNENQSEVPEIEIPQLDSLSQPTLGLCWLYSHLVSHYSGVRHRRWWNTSCPVIYYRGVSLTKVVSGAFKGGVFIIILSVSTVG